MKKTNIDGMRYPSIDELLKKINSKYKLAYVASKTAKLLKKHPEIKPTNCSCEKEVGKALEELLAGHISVEFKGDY